MPAALFVFVGFSDNCGLVFLILILSVFFFLVIIIVWIAGRRVERYRDEALVNHPGDEVRCHVGLLGRRWHGQQPGYLARVDGLEPTKPYPRSGNGRPSFWERPSRALPDRKGAHCGAAIRLCRQQAVNATEGRRPAGERVVHVSDHSGHPADYGSTTKIPLQYSSASVMVMTRWVTDGSAGSGECIDRF